MCLNHLQTIPHPRPWAVEKLSPTKSVPGPKNGGDCYIVLYICVCYGLIFVNVPDQ